MVNNVVRQSSKCSNFVAEESRFLKQKPNKTSNKKKLSKINPKLFIY